MIVVYKVDGSPPCRAVNMVVELLGLEIQTKEVNPLAGEQYKPEFLEKNPAHTIPVIEDGDFVLADSHAIITYLVSKYGGDKRSELYPSDLKVRALIDQRLHFDSATLFPKIRNVAMSIFKDKATEVKKEYLDAIQDAYSILEKYLKNFQFLVDDHITLADISIVASVSSLDVFSPIGDQCPKLNEWYNTIQQQDWYKKGNVPGLESITAAVNQILNK